MSSLSTLRYPFEMPNVSSALRKVLSLSLNIACFASSNLNFSLDRLEKEENEYYDNLKAQVLPPPPHPIGLPPSSSSATEETNRFLSKNPRLSEAVDLTAPPSGPLFWTQYRELYEQGLNASSAEAGGAQGALQVSATPKCGNNNNNMDSSSLSDISMAISSATTNRKRRLSGMSMDISRDSLSSTFSFASPTGRTG